MEEKLFSTMEIAAFNRVTSATVRKKSRNKGIKPKLIPRVGYSFTADMIEQMGYRVPVENMDGYDSSDIVDRKTYPETLYDSHQICERNNLPDNNLYQRQKKYNVVALRDKYNHKLFTKKMVINLELQIPGEPDMYFVSDICEEFEIPQTTMKRALQSIDCPLHTVFRHSRICRYLRKEEFELLKSTFKNMNKPNKPKMTLEEMRKLHPLVKNDRFFKTSFFPDVIPECFKESTNTFIK